MRPDEARALRTLLGVPALARVMEALHEGLVRHGEPRGRLKIETPEESDALRDVFGKRVQPGRGIELRKIDALLQERTVGHPTLKQAVELHRGCPIVRPKVERARAAAELERRRKRCFGAVRELALPSEALGRVILWLEEDDRGLRKHLRRWGDDGVTHVRAVAAVFGRLPGRGGDTVYLSEIASLVAGGQHALDANAPAGRLLYRALAWTFPAVAAQARPGSALWRTSLLTEAGIARDPVSSLVHACGLDGRTPYLRELRAAGHDRPLTLLTLRGIADDVLAWRQVAFVVENPAVYAALIDRVAMFDRRYHPTLVCTTGVLNLADHALLDALVRNGAHLFYSGDFDKTGLDIAASVLTRHGDAASAWRLTPDDYRASLREAGTVDGASLQRLSRHFPELVRDMTRVGRPGDQEKLIDALARDLHRFVTEGVTPPRRGGGASGPFAAVVV